jgi:threonine dehydratase
MPDASAPTEEQPEDRTLGPAVSIDDIRAAAARLAGVAHRTPVLRSHTLDERVGGEVLLKAENLQRIGAFKFRGAYNHVAALSDDIRSRGVLTCSSGNHSQAVALSARLHGTRAVVLMPEDAPAAKVAATAGYGAEILRFNRYTQDREEITAETAERLGLHVVHAYDDPFVIAGQGTTALELIEDAGSLDVLVVCLGGGGLLAGCSVAARALSPTCRIVGVEPMDRPAGRRAVAAGEPVTVPVTPTIADGQQSAQIGRRNFALISRHVDEIVGVTDEEIIVAMRMLFERLKVVVEPSGGSALAAILAGRIEVSGQRVGVTLSGGNIDAEQFSQLMGS